MQLELPRLGRVVLDALALDLVLFVAHQNAHLERGPDGDAIVELVVTDPLGDVELCGVGIKAQQGGCRVGIRL